MPLLFFPDIANVNENSYLCIMQYRSLIYLLIFSLLLAAPWSDAAVVAPGVKLMQSRHSRNADPASSKNVCANSSTSSNDDDDDEGYIPVIIKLANPSQPLPEGVVELYRRQDLLLAYVAASRIDQLASSGYFSRIEGREAANPALDRARTFTGFDLVANAQDLPFQFTGRNVVVGFTDSGFDPKHIEFTDPRNGESRVKVISHYPAHPDERVHLSSPAEIANWPTDAPDMYHATHVAGIMAGGYKGNDYYGIATEADIVASTSILYDALLLAGMEDVVAYAKEQDRPAVINMSISCGTGPHDGTSLFSQYLARMAEDAVICISSGNDGMRTGLFTNTFKADRAAAFTLIDIGMASWYASGAVDVWSDDATPLSFNIIIYDRESGQIVYRLPMPEITSENPEVYARFSQELSRYMEGYVSMATEINPDNGKFNATFFFDLFNYNSEETGKPTIRYAAGLEITGSEGHSVRVYAGDNLQMKLRNGSDGVVTSNGCLNDFITGDGIIGVGALTSRNSWPMADGSIGSSTYVEGKIADFSGFWREGTTSLPHIVAPGAHLISAISGHYAELYADEFMPAFSEVVNGSEYYWRASCGTSMSSPYVAGVCALMLEANPRLTPAQVKEIILSTASIPDIEPLSPRWGGGILNSYAAIKASLDRAALPGIAADASADITLPIEIYDLNGVLVTRCDAATPVSSIPLPAGVYIMRQGSSVSKILR